MIKGDSAEAQKALDNPNPRVRLYLLYGPDEAGRAKPAEPPASR